MARTKAESQDEITGLRDLSSEQREDIDALCDEGLMPSTIARRLGIPTSVAADARRAWRRQKEIDEKQQAPPAIAPPAAGDPFGQIIAMTQQQMQTTLLQAQIDAMVEANRHRKIANKLEERERLQELREREAQFREDYPSIGPADNETSLDEYDFENNPLGATMKFMKDIKAKNDASPDANASPQSVVAIDPSKPLSDEQIAAYVATLPPATVGKAVMAVDTVYQADLEAALRKNVSGISDDNIKRVVTWLRAEKARRAKK